jgi:hypothetical protein
MWTTAPHTVGLTNWSHISARRDLTLKENSPFVNESNHWFIWTTLPYIANDFRHLVTRPVYMVECHPLNGQFSRYVTIARHPVTAICKVAVDVAWSS